MANEYRVSQVAAEALVSGATPAARVSQFAVEVSYRGPTPSARVSGFALEVLRSVEAVPVTNTRRRAFFIN